jgi:hypothetical protein
MPWRCPACETQIRHSATEAEPRLGVVYRCNVCRLELVMDDVTQKLAVPPFPDESVAARPASVRQLSIAAEPYVARTDDRAPTRSGLRTTWTRR